MVNSTLNRHVHAQPAGQQGASVGASVRTTNLAGAREAVAQP